MTNKEIKTVTASSEDADKSEVYRLLNMIHATAGQCAVANVGSWKLAETCTMSHYVRTTWTNGIVDVIAESWPDDGDHRYTMKRCEVESEDE